MSAIPVGTPSGNAPPGTVLPFSANGTALALRDELGADIAIGAGGTYPPGEVWNETTNTAYTSFATALSEVATGDVIHVFKPPSVLPTAHMPTNVGSYTIYGHNVPVNFNNFRWQPKGDLSTMRVIGLHAVNTDRFFEIVSGTWTNPLVAGGPGLYFRDCTVFANTYGIIIQLSPTDATGRITIKNCYFRTGLNGPNTGQAYIESFDVGGELVIDGCYFVSVREGVSVRSHPTVAKTVRIVNTYIDNSTATGNAWGISFNHNGAAGYASVHVDCPSILSGNTALWFSNNFTQTSLDNCHFRVGNLRSLAGSTVLKASGGTGALINFPLFHSRVRGATQPLINNVSVHPGNGTNSIGM